MHRRHDHLWNPFHVALLHADSPSPETHIMSIHLATEMKTCFIAKHKTIKQIVMILAEYGAFPCRNVCVPLGLQALGIVVAAKVRPYMQPLS